jgi:hypothetical protein
MVEATLKTVLFKVLFHSSGFYSQGQGFCIIKEEYFWIDAVLFEEGDLEGVDQIHHEVEDRGEDDCRTHHDDHVNRPGGTIIVQEGNHHLQDLGH